ncbi:hypothetical protein L6452_13132 [Arctium lappa]|uniref:Uncharacterized protein n=1 Tax=Arctium lappa TaxID=4217 RepID=A0ACB9CHA6_ARCLA|nr:hypothetical protein L6452_13132 [Arctium lappa]
MTIEKARGRKKRDKATKWLQLALTILFDSETTPLKLRLCTGVVSMEAADHGGGGCGGGGGGIYYPPCVNFTGNIPDISVNSSICDP